MSYQDDNDRDAPPPLPAERNAYDEPYPEERERYAPPQQQGGCSKGCVYVLAGCGCLTVVALIAFGILAWQGFNLLKSAVSVDPAVVRATTREIADFEPPAGLQPRLRMHAFATRMVLYSSADGSSQLMMVQQDGGIGLQDKNQQDAFERGLRQGMQNPQGPRDLEIVKSELRDMKIRGQEAKVNFAEAKDRADGKEFQQIKGRFQGKTGPVEFQLQMPKEKYKEEDVVKFLESIK